MGGGLAGAMAAPSAIAPALGHLNFRGIGRPADGFSRHRTNNQGGLPPYLRAAIVPGQGGRLCRGTRPCPGSMAAVIIFGSPPPWGEGARVMGAGGSPRHSAINLKRGLPTAPILGGAEGGLSASYPSAGFLLSDSSYLQMVR